MEGTYLEILPSEIQTLYGRYRGESRFFRGFVNNYFIGQDPEDAVYNVEYNDEFNTLLKKNNLKSKLVVETVLDEDTEEDQPIETKILVFKQDYRDIITTDVLKQFMELILPRLFSEEEINSDYKISLYNKRLSDINFRLMKYGVPLTLIGQFWKEKSSYQLGGLYIAEIKNLEKLSINDPQL